MSSENTPLITTVRVAPPRQRYTTHSTLRRFCTIAFTSTAIFVILALLLPAALLPSHSHNRHDHDRPNRPSRPEPPVRNNPVSYAALQRILLETPDSRRAEEWSHYYTSGPHLAGKNLSQAEWTREKWQSWGVESRIEAYEIYINYPKGHRLALYERGGGKSEVVEGRRDGEEEGVFGAVENVKETWKVKFEAGLEEDVLKDDPTTGREDRVPTFHGYSASGNVTARYVYVNYGTYQDFEDLRKANVTLEGYIAIARYGGIFRGLKIKRAQELGMIGVLLYSDPGDDGPQAEHGDKTYPDGPARNPSSVQRGSAQFLSVAPGDPTTPGYPSKPGVPRQPVKGAIPSIPSLPISYEEVLPILKSLNGHGPNSTSFNKYWTRNEGLGYKGVKYNIGPSPSNLVLNLVNEQEYVITPIWNVIGIINGTLPDEVIVVGNHRDAWILGGAGDPNSGSAAINEVIRSFGVALSKGWKPLRTIVFASWDGEEYGLIGSTEWVEEYLPWLSAANVAYVNMDIGCAGPNLNVAASPLLNNVIYEVADLILSPNQTVQGQTLLDVWDGKIRTMGSGSDFTAFQDFAGIPSIDMAFAANDASGGGKDKTNPVYHYHSNYDSFHWMKTFGDPGFHYHVAAAKLLGLFTAKLSEMPVIPLNTTDYALALEQYVAQTESKLTAHIVAGASIDDSDDEHRMRPSISVLSAKGTSTSLTHKFKLLHRAVSTLQDSAAAFESNAKDLAEQAGVDIPWWKWISKLRLYWAIKKSNAKVKFLERQFLYAKGLDSRSWFKHVVFAPGLWTGYAGAVFPGLVEAIDAKDYDAAERWVLIIEDILKKAAKSLE